MDDGVGGVTLTVCLFSIVFRGLSRSSNVNRGTVSALGSMEGGVPGG